MKNKIIDSIEKHHDTLNKIVDEQKKINLFS